MGLTPTGGVIMGSRSDDLDPGVLAYLMREKKLDADQIEERVDSSSGPLGISGVARDMRRLQAVLPSLEDEQIARDAWAFLSPGRARG
jgi:acetate kinase